MESKKVHRTYVPPQTRNLSDLAVSGGGPGPLGICQPQGSFPWNGCSQGDAYGTTTDCQPGLTPTPGGNNCQAGPNPDTGTTQCYPAGSVAGNTCSAGSYA